MERYMFVSQWFLTSPIEAVWQALLDVERWPEWWPGVRRTRIEGRDHHVQAGTCVDYEIKGTLPYTLRFSMQVTALDAPEFLQAAVHGELEGDWRYVLEPKAGGTMVTFYWDNRTPKPIMNWAAKLPFVRGLFTENHAELMANGYRGLKARVECKLS